MTTLDDIRRESDPAKFPLDVLDGATSAALFFCAGFLGKNDGIHVLDAGIEHVVACDQDAAKVEEMRALYPSEWRFLAGDAFRHVDELGKAGQRFDVVIADPPTGLMAPVLLALPWWSALSQRFVVLGYRDSLRDKYGLGVAIKGWQFVGLPPRNTLDDGEQVSWATWQHTGP
jgi:hypothetical protein